MFTFVTVDMTVRHVADGDHARSISALIAEREKDPRKAAALARARKKLGGIIGEYGAFSLAQLRLSKGLSQQQLADAMGVKQPYIARVERGEDVKVSTISSLAKALGEPATVVFKAVEELLNSKEVTR